MEALAPPRSLLDTLLLRHRFELLSPMKVEDARQALATFMRYDLEVHGRVRGVGFWIRKRRQLPRQWNIETYIIGQFVSEGGGTRVICVARLGAVRTVFLLLFTATVLSTLFSNLLTALLHPGTQLFDRIVIAAAISLVCGCIFWVGLSERDEHEGQLVAHLRRVLRVS